MIWTNIFSIKIMLKYSTFSFMYILVYLEVSNASVSIFGRKRAKSKDMEGKIVGGVPIPLSMMPYNVQIFNMGAMCAGTILNSWTILTAAHCFDINKDIDEITVQVGSRYAYDFNAIQINLANVVTHNKYNYTGLFACDIALVFLENPIMFSENTKKAVLVTHKRWMNPKERNFTVTGWGWTQYGGPVSEEGLMMARLRYIPSEECSKLHKLEMSPDMFCLYGDGARDTCKGDSGGGVFWNGMLVGITSHGDGCANKHKPSVYTNVFHFRDWIEREVLEYINENCEIKITE